MSELKAYTFSNMEGRGLAEYYLKSEADKIIGRHKYKRCIAMARIAQDDCSFYVMGHQEFEKRKCEFYDKWRRRWLALAEQFKEEN